MSYPLASTAGVIGWTLLHAVWQVAAIHLTYVVVRARCRSPQARYAVGVASLAAIVAAVATTACLASVGTRLDAIDPTSMAMPQTAGPTSTADGATVLDPLGRTRDAPRNLSSLPRRLVLWLDEMLPFAVMAWSGGVAVLSCGHGVGLYRIRRLVRGCDPVESRQAEAWSLVALRLGLTRRVRFLTSRHVLVPMTVGWLKPAVLTPLHLATSFSAAEIEAMIAHELAHVRRLDFLVNQIQAVLESLLYFHPSLWLLSARIRRDRELCCDVLAVQACGRSKPLATALVRLADRRSMRDARLVAAVTGGSILERIAWMANGHNGPAVPLGTRALTTSVAAVTLLCLGAGFHQQAQADRELIAMLRVPECVALADIMGRVEDEVGFDRAFIDAMSAIRGRAAGSDDRYRRLVEASRQGVPGQLVWQAYTTQIEPDQYPTIEAEYPDNWQYGSPGGQGRLARQLWRQSKVEVDPDVSRSFALTALRIAVMRREVCQASVVSTIAFDTDFARLTKLDPITAKRIRRYVSAASDRQAVAVSAIKRLNEGLRHGRSLEALHAHLATAVWGRQRTPEISVVAGRLVQTAKWLPVADRQRLLLDAFGDDQLMTRDMAEDSQRTTQSWAIIDVLLAEASIGP